VQLREAGRRYAEAGAGSQLQMPPLVQRRPQPKARLRIGYLSADFHAHATVYLLAGVLEHHDAAHVELILYSYGPASSSGERQRLLERADAFHDLRELSDEAAARRIADDHIDILVDLKGYTVGQRPGITALRPAPLIVNWLGYPGSLGHPRMADYLIGDPVVSPPEHAAHFSEALALLPHCYQPNDNRRPLEPAPSRADAGLPATGLVFCSFNQTYKLRPETFAWWCRLLAAVPSSVLWLWQPKHETGVANLRRAAAGHGIAPERLVFAPSLPQAGHLARLQLADLALDSFPVCSHTTASDALWAGVPLVTRRGETFVSRVAASLLTAAGLADLVTASDEACFELALALATDPARLAAVRERLRGNRLTCPLFDTAGYTRDLEALYQRIWAEACNSVYPRG
jgi:predicted O-linked N-acetylglucosamine transferase (SPINDLY family)